MSRLSKYLKSAAEDGNPVVGVSEGEVRLLRDSDAQCLCGCGGETTSETADFLPGHDAKYKGILSRAHLRGDIVVWVDSDGSATTPATARDLADERGWSKYLDQAEKQAEKLRRQDRERPVRRKRVRRVVDPDTGEVEETSATMERIDVLKQAVEICKKAGVYLEPEGVTHQAARALIDGTHPALFQKVAKGSRVRLQWGRSHYSARVIKLRPFTVEMEGMKPARPIKTSQSEVEFLYPANPDHVFYTEWSQNAV